MEKHIIANRYVILEKIGTGGFATVYKAWARNLEKFVAVKKIHQSFSEDAAFLAMFRNEAVNTASLDHQNILKVIDFVEDSIVMDYVSGRDLAYILRKCRNENIKIPPVLGARMVNEVLKALDYAHSRKDEVGEKALGVVHRDVSPGNIMVYFDGRVKLADFGIAKVLSKETGKTRMGFLKGKISYMSPEQAEGSGDIDGRSDIFSSGIVLYELLSGKPLFCGDTDMEVLHRAREAKVDYEGIPEELKGVLARALRRNRKERYGNAKDMSADLEEYLSAKRGMSAQEDLAAFLKGLLREEIEKEGKEPHYPREMPARVSPLSSFRGFDGVRRHPLFKISVLLAAAGLLFGIFDVLRHRTPLVKRIAGVFSSQDFIIDTLPPGADLSLTAAGKEILGRTEKKTPLRIKKILPGEYLLVLQKDGYEPVKRKVSVTGSGICIDNAAAGQDSNGFVLPFKIGLEIKSSPADADVFIDGEFRGKTPLADKIDMGRHAIALGMAGFDKREECVIDTALEPYEQPSLDRKYWNVAYSIDDGIKTCVLEGSFFKKVSIDSYPPDASVYIDEAHSSAGVTPLKEFYIRPGKHRVRFEKYGFHRLTRTMDVTGDKSVNLCPVLRKTVSFTSYAENSPGKDIGCAVSIDGKEVRAKRTPFKYALSAGSHDITFGNEPGYYPRSMKVDVTKEKEVRGILKPKNAPSETSGEEADIADGILIVDTRPDFIGSSIFLDNKFQGETMRKISAVARGTHTVTIGHARLKEPSVAKVEFTGPCQRIIVRMKGDGNIYSASSP